MSSSRSCAASGISAKPFIAVGIMPGAYALTVMFQGPSSPASVRVNCTTAAFEAAYAELPTLGTIAANEAALMIRPEFCAFMPGSPPGTSGRCRRR